MKNLRFKSTIVAVSLFCVFAGSAFSTESEEPPACEIDMAEQDLGAMINEWVEFGGAIEVEGFYIRDFEKHEESKISLETAELDFEIFLTDCVTGILGLEWEPDDDHVTVKEAFVTFGNIERCPLFVQVGRIFVPFGISTGAVVGDTLSISDPLTIEVFETREDVIYLGWERCGWHTGAYIFNGETNKGGNDDHLDKWGATVRYGKDTPDTSYSVGLDFISSVFDSDSLQEEFPDALESDYAPGFAAHVRYATNGFSLIAEYNGAFESASFIFDEEDLREAPKAWQIELGYETEICCRPTYFAFNYSESYDLHGVFPKRRYLFNVGTWLYEDNILLAFEYGHDQDYSKSNGGTGSTLNSFITQLVYEW